MTQETEKADRLLPVDQSDHPAAALALDLVQLALAGSLDRLLPYQRLDRRDQEKD
jgi:hypothetical protein